MLVSAIPIPALDVRALTNGADLIVVGRVTDLWEEGPSKIEMQGQSIPARRIVAVLSTVRILKGGFNGSTVSFRFLVPDAPLGYGSISRTQFGMFFLRQAGPNKFFIVNQYYPFLVALVGSPEKQNSILDQVIAEVAQVLVAQKTTRAERKQAINILDRVITRRSTEALRKASNTLDSLLRLQAAAALLRRNDISTLEVVESILFQPPPKVEQGVLRNLAFAIKDGIEDPQAVPVLSRLLNSPEAIVRQSSAAALRRIGTESVLLPLSEALWDNDREVRYQAVLGLAIVTRRSDWAPSLDRFMQEEQLYLTYWRKWVKSR